MRVSLVHSRCETTYCCQAMFFPAFLGVPVGNNPANVLVKFRCFQRIWLDEFDTTLRCLGLGRINHKGIPLRSHEKALGGH